MDEDARQWHLAHRLGSRASLDDRVAWHVEHARHCRCREMPEPIRQEIERRGLQPEAENRLPEGPSDGAAR